MVKQHPYFPTHISCLCAREHLVCSVLNVLRETPQIHRLLGSTMRHSCCYASTTLRHTACDYDSTVMEDVGFAEDDHKASPKHSPRRSPRGVAQTASQQPPLSSEPQAGPLSPVPGALPQQALSPSLPSQPQPSPPVAIQAPGHSASSAHPNITTSASFESLSRCHAASAVQPSADPPLESSSPNITADSVMQHQQRADLSQPAQSHQRGRPALSVRTTSLSPAGPPNQELLAGLGSALRAQARLRRKAVAPETASPDDRESSVTGNLGDVSPSGQLSFDDIELKSKGTTHPYTWQTQSGCFQLLCFTMPWHDLNICAVVHCYLPSLKRVIKVCLGIHHG